MPLASRSVGHATDVLPYSHFPTSANRPSTSSIRPPRTLTDLPPTHAIEGDPSRTYPLVLEDYRQFLQQGVRELASLRKVQAAKRKAQVAKGKEESHANSTDDRQDGGDSGHE